MAGITGELRAWADEFPLHGGPLACVLACADRIDERHEDELGAARAKVESEYDGWYPPREVEGMRRFAERLEAAAAEHADVTLFGVDYTALPVDADGVPIHVRDVIAYKDNTKPKEVVALVPPSVVMVEDGPRYADMCSHYRAPTVEDVLDEFVARWMETHHDDLPSLKAEYAAKLQLRESS